MTSKYIQNYVDSTYPPTHTYDVDSLKPTKVLKQRVDLISKSFPHFFEGKRLLDIGCSKGWFSLSSGERFRKITALDCDKNNIDLCDDLSLHENTEFLLSSFRDFISTSDFDRIFVGNVAHHLFMAIRGWQWIAKLAALSSDLVLIEGASTTKCKDIYKLVPKSLHSEFNRFQHEMKKYFTLERTIPTVRYTPDRYLMLWKRKKLPRLHLKDLRVIREIKNLQYHVFVTNLGWMRLAVAKVMVGDNIRKQQLWRDHIRVRVAAASPVSNGMVGEIVEGSEVVGWLENFSQRRKTKYFEDEVKCWNKICEHNIFFSKLGYVDLDPATINFFKRGKMFDKSCVFPISHLLCRSADSFLVMFKQSYKEIPVSLAENIVAAIKTQDSVKVEQAFKESII